MTSRDRLMLMGIVALAILVGAWFTKVAPERQRAAKLDTEVQAAHQQVASAESQADSAVSARDQYSAAYTSLVSLGQAVPSTPETPALIFTLDRTTHRRDVQFTSISTATSGSASSSGPSATATGASATATFTQMPFTFVFNGSFVDLYKLMNQLEGFTAQTPGGTLHVNGRLLTINDVNLAPASTATQPGGKAKATELTGTINATAYVLPAGASTLAGATPSGPTATEAAAGSGGSAGTPAPAVVKAP